ncbi:MAG: lysoplasmalogenase family protein [Candidatus Woesearchaeota archaeon]|jgi:hypothetical protein|nr:lysoplasmalogenase family protein [Candidatus Woesearchaeota archaeon]
MALLQSLIGVILFSFYMIATWLIVGVDTPKYLDQAIIKTVATSMVIILVVCNLIISGTISTYWPLILTILFCVLGDFILGITPISRNNVMMFQIGTGLFWLAYIILGIFLFTLGKDASVGLKIFIPLLFLGSGFLQMYFMTDLDGLMEIIVGVYLIMTVVLITGALAYINVGAGPFLIAFGAIMFYISDCIIGQNQFGLLKNQSWSEWVIMGTYGLGQLSLIYGSYMLR